MANHEAIYFTLCFSIPP